MPAFLPRLPTCLPAWSALLVLLAPLVCAAGEAPSVKKTVAAVDRILADHWKSHGVQPAKPADDAALLRRAMLDLCGRLPTTNELDAFAADDRPDRRSRLLQKLIESDEFSLHLARVVDGWVQQRNAGDEAFVGWLRQSLDQRRGWDEIFRTLLVGPWDKEADKSAAKFLSKRVKNLDALTADSAQAFFGVDISCARCHDHPLVDQWKQKHYYGLAAFFGRTKEDKKAAGQITEKSDGEVTYAARGGKQETAPMMFLSGREFASLPKENRRERLVDSALNERVMFSRAAVNRMWAWFFGRGLVNPVDQMHAANPPSVPGLLERLADDFAEHDYDLRFLAAAIVESRAYQLSSRYAGPTSATPPEDLFAAMRLRPLTREQYALSIELALCYDSFAKADEDKRRDLYLAAEKRAAEWTNQLDPAGVPHQASAAEALFLSNHPTLLKLTTPVGDNLAARLAKLDDADAQIDETFRTLLGRKPTKAERKTTAAWLKEHQDRNAAVSTLLWAVATSAEFRFNH